LAVQLARSRRSGEPFCVLMLDADHFKHINDRYGHAVGDLALKHLSKLLRAHMRDVDRLARFGGEEFLVLLPGLALADALPVAERLRELVASEPLPHADGVIRLSVSIGMAEWGGADEDASRLLVRADAALYEAKRRGRDRVASAGHDLDSEFLPV
jgi:diguanylate cyclase (GGDEF)-like protein